MSESLCRKCRVRGRVQGVFFRASTAEQAARLGLTGHALNLPDGSVEVLACGDAAAVAELCEWLAHGPRMAEVESLECQPFETEIPAHFSTG